MSKHKQKIIICAILGVCLLGTMILLLVNRGHNLLLQQLQEQALLNIVDAEGNAATLSYEQICALPPTEFTATIRSAGQAPVEAAYLGAAFADVLAAAGLAASDISDCSRMVVTAADGYVVSFRLRDVLAEENLYLVYMQDGEIMRPRELGGFGPYQLIARKDSFSQRWAKYAVEIRFDRE